MRNVRRVFLLAFAVLASLSVEAIASVPKEAVKALLVTKGKPCRSGIVFMDGKYIAPPYTVKRYGTAIMINDVQVTAPLVSWEEFVATQGEGAVKRTEAAASDAGASGGGDQAVQTSNSTAADAEEDPLADLFDDDPKPKAARRAASDSKRSVVRSEPTPKVVLEGPFVHNDASKKLLERINRYRSDVNARLLRGGFIFFGSRYACVSGEARETGRLLQRLPNLMRNSASGDELSAGLRRNGFYYLTDAIAADLFRHKYQYPQIESHANKLAEDAKMENLLKGE